MADTATGEDGARRAGRDDDPRLDAVVAGDLARQVAAAAGGLAATFGAAVILGGGDAPTVGGSTPEVERLARHQVLHDCGPALEAWRSGCQVLEPSLAGQGTRRWPGFALAALDAGVGAVASFPLQATEEAVGALDVYLRSGESFTDHVLVGAGAVAHMATTMLGFRRQHDGQRELAGQLQGALDSRVIIEQAKGALAAKLGVQPDEAFEVLRREARTSRRKLAEVAADVLGGLLPSSTAGS